MAAYARVSRDVMYQGLGYISLAAGAAATEEEDKRQPKRKQRARKYKNIDIDHLSDLDRASQESISDNSKDVEQETMENNKAEVKNEEPRATTSALQLLIQNFAPPTSDPPNSSDPPHQNSSPAETPGSQESRKKRRRGKKKKKEMPTKLEGMFIPPHMRKKNIGVAPNTIDTTPQGQEVTVEVSTASTRPLTFGTALKRPESLPSPPTSSEPFQNNAASGTQPAKSRPAPTEEKPTIWGEWTETPVDVPNEQPDNSHGPSNGLGRPKWNGNKKNSWPKGQRRKPNHTPWPKNRDMRALPTDPESEGGCELKSNSGGDPDYDIKKLVDWEGNWLPAGEWAGRKNFADRHFGDRIEEWARGIPSSVEASEIIVSEISNFLADNNTAIVAIWWIPQKLEGDSPSHFWRSLPSRAPAPVDEEDLNCKPWWEMYADKKHQVLDSIQVPDARVDPADGCNRHPGVRDCTKDIIIRKELADKARYDKIMKMRDTPVKEDKAWREDADQFALVKPIIPEINLYLRPVRPSDVDKIAAIYNHYVENSILANEFTKRSQAQMRVRIDDIVRRGLPWIVAVAKAGGRNRQLGYISENIIGFAMLDDYCDQGSMYRFTFEMELFVHPEYLGKKVGSCLLDKTLSMVATGYNPQGGYEWRPAENYLVFGSSRVTKTVNISYPHENYEAASRPEVLKKWFRFMERYGFRISGRLRKVGYKYGKAVDVSVFQYETTEVIFADQRPTIPL